MKTLILPLPSSCQNLPPRECVSGIDCWSYVYLYSLSSEEQHINMIKSKVENIKDKIDGNELDLSLSNLTEVPVKELVSSLTFQLSWMYLEFFFFFFYVYLFYL